MATKEVPLAVWGGNRRKNIKLGTSTIPPPIPKSPEQIPAITPKPTIDIHGITFVSSVEDSQWFKFDLISRFEFH